MIDQRVTVHTRRAPDDVFAFVAQAYFANHPRWDPDVVGMEPTSTGPSGVGATGREVRKFVTKQAADFAITGFDPPKRFGLTNTSGPFELDRE
jgi:polyketide cyclase/dehydrase/lipid transport protein